ncbi:MAG: hypothetical protein AB8I69_00975 [Anaerolineae bacterium]|jgi:hypothetical protein
MSRIIATEGPGKIRSQHRRTIAEALRRLSMKQRMDDEVKDLVALIVLCLHRIADTIEQTTEAWEKRDYYLKADRFREEWRWVEPMADQLSAVIYEERWGQMPDVLVQLMPYFSDVTIKKMTRQPSLWQGAYEKFMQGD